jgi:putative PEP-CTERM system TPR-repeat lipoprotein
MNGLRNLIELRSTEISPGLSLQREGGERPRSGTGAARAARGRLSADAASDHGPFASLYTSFTRTLTLLLAALTLAACLKDSPEKLVASAKDYLARGEYNAAVIQLKNALQEAPTHGEARLLLGRALLETRDPVSAEKELRRALEYKQSPQAVLPLLARALIEQGEAAKLVQEFASHRLDDVDADASFRARLGDAFLRLGRRQEAADAYGKVLSAKPGFAPARMGQARLAALDGRADDAIAIVDEVKAAEPKFADAHLLKAELLSMRGQPDAAVAELRQAIAADPGHLPARFVLISQLIDARDFDGAAAQIGEARKYARGDLRVNYFEGLLALRRGDVQRARDQVLQVLKHAPDHVPSLVLAGAVELRANQPLAAEAYLRKAVSRAPEHLGAQRMLVGALLRAGQPAKAVEALQPLVQHTGIEDPQVLMLAGETYLANGDLKQAASYFTSAASSDAQKVAARTRLGQIALATGRTEAGIRELEAASELDAGQHQADLVLIVGHLRSNRTDRALEAARNLEKKQPDNPLSHYVLGIVHAARKDAAAARRSFEKALALRPSYLPAAQGLAALDLAEKKPDAARARYESMIAADPKNEQIYVALADLLARTGSAPADVAATLQRAVAANPQSADARLALIGFQLRAHDSAAAVAAARDAVKALPSEPRVLDALAEAQIAAGQSRDAIETLKRSADLQPQAVRPLVRLAAVQAGAKEHEAAIETLRRAQRLAPNDVGVVRSLVASLVQSQRHEEALREAKALQAREPKSAAGFALEGDVLAAQGKHGEAERAYRDGLKVDAKSGALAVGVYSALVGAGKRADADAFAREWSARNPRETVLSMHLADRALRARDFRVAAAYYQVVVATEPNHVIALNNLAWTSGQLGDPKALGYAERAVKLAPNNAAVLDTLGMLLAARGEGDKALVHLQKARALAPNRADIRLNYAKALAKAGRRDRAKTELEALLAIKEDFPGKEEAAALLRSL